MFSVCVSNAHAPFLGARLLFGDLICRVGYYSAVVRADEARSIGREDRASDLDAASEFLRDHLPSADSYRVLDVLRVAGVQS